MYGEAQEISRDRWQSARRWALQCRTRVVRLRAASSPVWYDLIYVPRDCPVVGAGLLAMRDRVSRRPLALRARSIT
jgi:hypothetical protein